MVLQGTGEKAKTKATKGKREKERRSNAVMFGEF